VRVVADRAFGRIVEAGLRMSGLEPAAYFDEDRDRATVELYARTRRQGRALLGRVRRLVAGWAEPGERWRASIRCLRRTDWAESWKRFFRVERVSRRIVVRPPWRRYRPRAGEVVVDIEPGMSFGTGQHGTTRSCLRLLDRLEPRAQDRVLDLGCGSGILGIAAAKLGCERVEAVDNDPGAVRIAAENVAVNGVASRVSCRVADLSRMRCRGRYDVVMANILANVLIRHAGRVSGLVAPGRRARLILSGILAGQYGAVRRAYEGAGLAQVGRIRDGEWVSGLFARRARTRRYPHVTHRKG
jgi:ribosomal protein L11 methyltransferase